LDRQIHELGIALVAAGVLCRRSQIILAQAMKHKSSISHDEAMVRQLREDPDFAAEYLKAALEDADEPRVLLVALRRVGEARGGIAKLAKAAGVERESLYRALSVHGNPRLPPWLL
jgi:probable addiction module antidote protein